MDPVKALVAFGDEGPRLRRWEAKLLAELRHGESPGTALASLAFSGLLTLAFAGVAATPPVDSLSAGSALLAVASGVLTSIEYRWWRWLHGRERAPKHRR